MGSKYRPRQHLNRVLAASFSTHSARAVLMVMCWRAEFDRPEVTITVGQIQNSTGLARWTVQAALRQLKREGSIEVLSNRLGGRSNAPTYRLHVSKGANSSPPSIDSIDSTGDAPDGTSERPAAGRGGSGINRQDPDRARQWRRQQAEKREKAEREALPLTPERKAAIERFILAKRLAGDFVGAQRLIAAWDAGEIEEGQI